MCDKNGRGDCSLDPPTPADRACQMTKPIREIRIEGNIAYVPLTKGYTAVIDALDVPLVDGWNWHATSGRNIVYATRREYRDGSKKFVRMHRLICGASGDVLVDHANGNGLDNRRANIRLATRSQNLWNQPIAKHNTSGFKGVSFIKRTKRYRAAIGLHGKMKYLGYFATAELAHEAYVAASILYHGEFRRDG